MKQTMTMMALGLSFLIGSTALAEAQDLNRSPFLDPEIQSKVNTVRAKAMLLGNQNRDIVQFGSGASCGDLILNESEDPQRPGDQIIVANNIINVNSNCRR